MASSGATFAQPAAASTSPDSHFRLHSEAAGELTLSGYAEMSFTYNLATPSNKICNSRAFDFGDDTIALQNAVLAADWNREPVFGRIALQNGLTGDSYSTLSEPAFAGASGAPPTSPAAFQHIQEAYFDLVVATAWTFEVDRVTKNRVDEARYVIGALEAAALDPRRLPFVHFRPHST
ncbi:MAG: outer membrane beta-barrel protein [Polyangiaceae bacterium]